MSVRKRKFRGATREQIENTRKLVREADSDCTCVIMAPSIEEKYEAEEKRLVIKNKIINKIRLIDTLCFWRKKKTDQEYSDEYELKCTYYGNKQEMQKWEYEEEYWEFDEFAVGWDSMDEEVRNVWYKSLEDGAR